MVFLALMGIVTTFALSACGERELSDVVKEANLELPKQLEGGTTLTGIRLEGD